MTSLESLLLAIVVGYLLGAVPVAALVSRSRGVDIFTAGTRWAGAANVFRQVGHKAGIIVFLGDFAKGALVIIIASRLGLEAHMLLVPAMLALIGHWRSVFTRFKGGDGLSTLLGITIALFTVDTLISAVPAIPIGFLARYTGHHPTLWGGAVGYGILLWRTADAGPVLALGVLALAILVLGHAVLSHRRQHTAPA